MTASVEHKHNPEVSVVIPVYRAEASLKSLTAQLCDSLEGRHIDFEVIFVEDCGGDDSWQIIEQLAASDPRISGIAMSRNFGQHNALLCGIRKARGRVIVTMDDDLQHPPEEVHKLLDKLDEGYDVVYGPAITEQHGAVRNFASRLIKLALATVMGAENAREASAFRAFHTRLRDAFADYRSPTVSIDVLLAWATDNFGAVRVRHAARTTGVSGYTARKLLQHALNMMTSFSTRPLHIAGLLGFASALFGLVILGYVIIQWLVHGSSVPGFAFLASMIAIFSGSQLLAVGIIGEYLARMHFRTIERPAYVVRSETQTQNE